MMTNMPGAPQPPMMPMAPNMMNQSMMTSNSAVSSSNPQYADHQYALKYHEEIQSMFCSQEFKNAPSSQKKEIVGNTIYKHVDKLVGEQRAPKITGMLIDLPESELNFSISQWVNFEQKVMSALNLINKSDRNANSAPQAPVDTKA